MSSIGLRLASSKVSRTSSAVSHLKSRWGTRNVHKRRALPYSIEDGLGEFLPPAALKTVAVEYQEGLLQRLNEEVRGTPEQNITVTQTVINTAPHRDRALAFNYASLALNNSFFLDQLKPPPPEPELNHQAAISTDLGSAIRMQHGSVAQLKSSFSAAATGLFTNGWVWFVVDQNGNTGVIPTFGPGTLLIRSRTYMAHSKNLILGEGLGQWDRGNPYNVNEEEAEEPFEEDEEDEEDEELITPPPRSPTAHAAPPGVNPSSPVSGVSGVNTPTPPSGLLPKFMHTSARLSETFDLEIGQKMPSSVFDGDPEPRTAPMTKTDMLNIGETLYPLFCISVHEHAWMAAGYGVWGKEEWLKKFWTVLDWRKVSQSYSKAVGQRSL